MKLRPMALFAAALICAIAALGKHIQHQRDGSPPDTEPDPIPCWIEKGNGQAIQKSPETNPCSDW